MIDEMLEESPQPCKDNRTENALALTQLEVSKIVEKLCISCIQKQGRESRRACEGRVLCPLAYHGLWELRILHQDSGL